MKLRKKTKKIIRRWLRLPFWFCLLAIFGIVYDVGFEHTADMEFGLCMYYVFTLALSTLAITARHIFEWKKYLYKVKATDTILVIFLLLLISRQMFILGFWHDWLPSFWFLDHRAWLYIALPIAFLRELSALNLDAGREWFTPAQLLIVSFLSLILAGTLLLLLPKATYTGISFINALFTATSAVCVTGLIVVDTSTYFTHFGQVIILLLIQVGGIGIMTFTSYFSYFFKGGSSFETQLVLSDMTNANKIADVFGILRKIIILTFVVEAFGGILIYASIADGVLPPGQKLFFSIFHTISAFCNAGFSTLTDGLYDVGFRFNYFMQLSIIMLFIIGGLGFPIVFNFLNYLKHFVKLRILSFGKKRNRVYLPWVININSRIVMVTTVILLGAGFILFYVLEFNNTLAEHSGAGKIVTALFGAATPRTAGFNTIDMASLTLPTLLIVIFLMWVGASPASTGGGIKTSTLAIGVLNFMSLAREKNRLEVFKREISEISVRRAFAIVFLSLLFIGLSAFFIVLFDGDKGILEVVFECFSAFSTVGLSLGITAKLSAASKIVLIVAMFIGRLGTLTILVAIIRRARFLNYRYPSENILIN